MPKQKTELLYARDPKFELTKEIDKLVEKSNGKYSSRSHFVRVAVLGLLLVEKEKTGLSR